MPRLSFTSFRHTSTVLGLALFASYAYFYQAGGWNQNSRFALVRAVLERQTLQIDAYHEHTGDRALWQGHYYSDKAPGTSLLALAPAGIARGISRLAGVNPRSYAGIAWTSYAATVATSGLFTLLAALVVMRLALKWGFSRNAALFAATAYGVASPAWCYATLFMGHAVAAGSLMLAYAAAIDLADESSDALRVRRAWAVGFWTGLAVLCEFQTAVASFFIVIMATMAAREQRPQRSRGMGVSVLFMRIMAGGMISGAVLLAYNTLAFGNPFHLGYASEEGFEQLRVGFFGITYPALWRVREILVGAYRGLLPLSPLIALTPVGLAMIGRTRSGLRPALVAGLIALYYLLLNASYYYWEGGWAYGPRQIMPALPFLALGLAPLWDAGRRMGRALLSAGWLWGAALTLIAVSTTPQPPAVVRAPVRELLWPAFRDGDLSLNYQTFVQYSADANLLRGDQVPHAAWNLGELAGLDGLPSLIPLLLIWLAAAVLLVVRLKPDTTEGKRDPGSVRL